MNLQFLNLELIFRCLQKYEFRRSLFKQACKMSSEKMQQFHRWPEFLQLVSLRPSKFIHLDLKIAIILQYLMVFYTHMLHIGIQSSKILHFSHLRSETNVSYCIRCTSHNLSIWVVRLISKYFKIISISSYFFYLYVFPWKFFMPIQEDSKWQAISIILLYRDRLAE